MKRRMLALIVGLVFMLESAQGLPVFAGSDTDNPYPPGYSEYVAAHPKALLEYLVDRGATIAQKDGMSDEAVDGAVYDSGSTSGENSSDTANNGNVANDGAINKGTDEGEKGSQDKVSAVPGTFLAEQAGDNYMSYAMQGIIDAFAGGKDPNLQQSFDFSNFQYTDPQDFPTDEELFGVWDPAANDFIHETKVFQLHGPDGKVVSGRTRVMAVPLLDYNYVSPYPGVNLDAVKKAVKENNYTKAKNELYKYYQAKKEARGAAGKGASDRQTLLSAYLLMQDMHYNNLSGINVGDIAYMEPGSNFQPLSFDMKDEVTRFMDDGTTYNYLMPVQVLAVNKDGYEAEFKKGTKGADGYYPVQGDSPYLEVHVGSTTKYVPAKYITYTRAGNPYANQTFGDDPAIYACESRTSIRTDNSYTSYMKLPVDEGTKRTFIMFDLGKVMKPGEKISSATLRMQGKFYPANDGVQPPVSNPPDPHYKKRIVAVTTNDIGWTDKKRTSATTPVDELYFGNQSHCNAIFSYDGEYGTAWRAPLINDGTDPVTSRGGNPVARFEEDLFRQGWTSNLYNAFEATGNQLYAQTLIMYLQDWIMKTYNRYTGAPGVAYPKTSGGKNIPGLVGGGYRKGLDLHSRSSNWPGMINHLMGTKDNPSPMTPEIFATFLKYAWSMGETHSQYWTDQERGNNWGTASCNGFFQIMGNYPEFAAVDQPVYDSDGKMLRDCWSKIMMERLDENTSRMVFADGSCYELANGYNQYSLTVLFSTKNTAEAMQVEVKYTDEIIQRIVDLSHCLMITTAPGWRNTQEGDGGAYSKDSDYRPDISKCGYWLENDPKWGPKVQDLLWVATGGDTGNKKARGTPPDFTSYRYWDSRKVDMRTGWDPNAVFLQTTADGSDGSHGHWDENNIIAAAYGDNLLSDAGFYMYDSTGSNLEVRWLYSSRAHNVMQMNDFSSKSVGSAHDKALPIESIIGDNGRSNLRSGNTMKETVLNDSYDFSKISSQSYKDITYRMDPIILPGKGDGSIPHDDGMDYTRNILFVKPNFWIVSDYMDPVGANIGKENKYTQLWHMMPGVNMTIDGCVGPYANDTQSADSQVANTLFVPGKGNGTIRSHNAGGTNMMVVPADINSVEPKLLWGRFSYSTNSITNLPYGAFEKHATGTTSMDTVLFPTRPGSSYSVDPTPLDTGMAEGQSSAFKAEVKDASGASNENYQFSYYILHQLDKQKDVTFGDTATNGEVAYYEKDLNNGRPRRVILRNGTYVLDEKENMFAVQDRGGKTIPELSVEWNGTSLKLTSTPNIETDYATTDYEEIPTRKDSVVDLTDMIIYSPVKVSTVSINGKTVPFNYKNSYVYFNSTPPTGGKPEETPAPGQDSPSKPHGGGSTGGINPGLGGSGSTPVPNPPVQIPTPAVSDKDKLKQQVAGLWSEQEIKYLIDHDIVTGSNGMLNLYDSISRAEFTSIMLRAMGIQASHPWTGDIADVSGDAWYASTMQTAYDIGLIQGNGGNVRPDDLITREEMAKMLVSAYSKAKTQSVTASGTEFTDKDQISAWAMDYVNKAYTLGLITGYDDGSFKPEQNATREQAMVMTYRLVDFLGGS